MAAKKVNVRVDCTQLSVWDFEGTLGEIQNRVNKLVEEYGPEARMEYGQYDCWDDHYSFMVTTERDETKEERVTRIAKEKADQQKREEAERKQLAVLMRKYGPTSAGVEE